MLLVTTSYTQVTSLPQKQTSLSIDDDFVFSVGFNAGINQNINAYRSSIDNNGFSFYGKNPQYNFNFDFGVFLTPKFRPRIELGYSENEYGMNWTSNYPSYDHSTTHLQNFDLNLHLDYSLLKTKYFQLYASPAFMSEYIYNRSVTNVLADGSTTKSHYNIIDKNYKNSYYGAAMSMLFIYRITENIDFVLTPQYTYYFDKFVSGNSKNYQRISANVGFGMKF